MYGCRNVNKHVWTCIIRVKLSQLLSVWPCKTFSAFVFLLLLFCRTFCFHSISFKHRKFTFAIRMSRTLDKNRVDWVSACVWESRTLKLSKEVTFFPQNKNQQKENLSKWELLHPRAEVVTICPDEPLSAVLLTLIENYFSPIILISH